MAHIPYLGSALQPAQLCHASKSDWKLGIPCLLPKWKAPGSEVAPDHCDKSKTARHHETHCTESFAAVSMLLLMSSHAICGVIADLYKKL